MTVDLKSLLTPELFRFLVDTRIPFSKTETIDLGEAIAAIFFEQRGDSDALRNKAWPALKALSLLGLDGVPDLFQVLPPPDDTEFPLQALGLQLLLDQATRSLLKGVDTRWTYGYFAEIDLKYAKQLQALPAHLNPTSWSRWQDSVSINYFVFVRLWFGTPLVHHETAVELAVSFTDETRKLVEQIFETHDPIRGQPEKRWDLYGFPTMLKNQGPTRPCSVADGAFWLACLMDVHKPPLDLYGRYPYNNAQLGRVDTPEEAEWMKKAEIFDTDREVRRRIRQDVEAGKWTPLGEAD
ncbi:hypothetical protein SCUP515_05134 [Seiridium cupressi]